jgi:predicted peptidase
MRRTIAAWILAVAGMVFADAVLASELRREVLHSRYIGQDLPYLVYVPDGYDGSELSYPVLYLLHGAGDNERAWVERGARCRPKPTG